MADEFTMFPTHMITRMKNTRIDFMSTSGDDHTQSALFNQYSYLACSLTHHYNCPFFSNEELMTLAHDFHVHTYYSDGELSPEEVVREIAEQGVQTLAITDHENIHAWYELKHLSHDIELIPGIELDVLLDGREIHILGIGCQPDHPALTAYLEHIQQVRQKMYKEALNSINKILGEPFMTPEETFPIPHSTWMKPLVFKKLNSHPKFQHIPSEQAYSFFKQWLHENEIHIHIPKPSIHEMIDLIRKTGGEPVLAHPGYYIVHGLSIEPLLPELKSLGLSGIEVFYPYHQQKGDEFPTEESALHMVKYLLHLAQKHGLRITQGSDVHLREHITTRFLQLRRQLQEVGEFETPAWLSVTHSEALEAQI